MNRYIRHAALLGAVMLGTACEQSVAPAESDVVPRPQFIPASDAPLPTRVSGLAWDPEAFWFNLAMCGPTCPIPPMRTEGTPHYLRSAVRGASILAFDPLAPERPQPIGQPAAADNIGMWVLPSVPARTTAPFLIYNTGAGALPDPTEPIGPPFPAAPRTTYVPTLTLRPIFTGANGTCVSQESAHIGKNGILEAVAKHLTAGGSPTTVDDLVTPSKYWGATVFWFYNAGNPNARSPAGEIALEVSREGGTHQQFTIDWAPPGALPVTANQSARGFYVSSNPVSARGIYVVLFPRTGPAPTKIEYLIKDNKTDALPRRPWRHPPVHGSIAPGMVIFAGLQMQFQPYNPLYTNTPPPPPYRCAPPPPPQ